GANDSADRDLLPAAAAGILGTGCRGIDLPDRASGNISSKQLLENVLDVFCQGRRPMAPQCKQPAGTVPSRRYLFCRRPRASNMGRNSAQGFRPYCNDWTAHGCRFTLHTVRPRYATCTSFNPIGASGVYFGGSGGSPELDIRLRPFALAHYCKCSNCTPR